MLLVKVLDPRNEISGEALHSMTVVGIFFNGDKTAGVSPILKHVTISKRFPQLIRVVASNSVSEGKVVASCNH
jgi:hypothetical protein